MLLREPFGNGVHGLGADDESDADHGTDQAEGARTGMELVADVNGDQGAEAAEDEHCRHHGDHYE